MTNGFLLINKPAGPTSHDVIDELRRITGIRQIGHAGTLDPFASGLLLVGMGETTKLLFRKKKKQPPPMFSAKKIGGKKLYELARQGQNIERKAVDIDIYDIKL